MGDVFNLDVWVSESRRAHFQFELAGEVFSLPPAGELDKKVLKSVDAVSPGPDDIEKLLRAGLGAQWERFDEIPLPLAAVGELFRRWQNHEGVPLGESSASSGS